MSLLPRVLATFTLLALAFPSVLANSSSCKSDEFWYDNQGCCVPSYTPETTSNPPTGKSCPSSHSEGWYWSDDKSCCLPTAPPKRNPEPTCYNGHLWNNDESCCEAPPSAPGDSGPDDCSDDEFWYDQQTTCLPYGGPPKPSNPPTGSGCPQSGWYWGEFLSCCLPHYPNPPSPECPQGWQWDDGNYKCSPISTPPNPYNPQPSYGYGDRRRSKRAQQPRTTDLCPSEMTACPVVGNYGVFSDYECIDTAYELQSCGGCSSTGAGQDCTTIRGAWNVGCEYGHCIVYNCMTSFRLASNGNACVPL